MNLLCLPSLEFWLDSKIFKLKCVHPAKEAKLLTDTFDTSRYGGGGNQPASEENNKWIKDTDLLIPTNFFFKQNLNQPIVLELP